MLFNGHKLTDLLYLQESLDGSEKAHQGLLSSFRLFTFLHCELRIPIQFWFSLWGKFQKSAITSKVAGQRDETDVLLWYFTEIL